MIQYGLKARREKLDERLDPEKRNKRCYFKRMGETGLFFIFIYIDSPHQKVLRHSGLIIHTLDNVAIIGNRTPSLQMAKSA